MALVILPAFNEERNLMPLLRALGNVMTAAAIPHRIVDDDGDADGTRAVAELKIGRYLRSRACLRLPVPLAR